MSSVQSFYFYRSPNPKSSVLPPTIPMLGELWMMESNAGCRFRSTLHSHRRRSDRNTATRLPGAGTTRLSHCHQSHLTVFYIRCKTQTSSSLDLVGRYADPSCRQPRISTFCVDLSQFIDHFPGALRPATIGL